MTTQVNSLLIEDTRPVWSFLSRFGYERINREYYNNIVTACISNVVIDNTSLFLTIYTCIPISFYGVLHTIITLEFSRTSWMCHIIADTIQFNKEDRITQAIIHRYLYSTASFSNGQMNTKRHSYKQYSPSFGRGFTAKVSLGTSMSQDLHHIQLVRIKTEMPNPNPNDFWISWTYLLNP